MALEITKLLTYVFEDDAPLPRVERLELTDGLYLAAIQPLLLQSDDKYQLMAVNPSFSKFFRDHLQSSTLNVTYRGRNDLNYEGVESEEELAKRKINEYLLSAMIFTPRFLAPYAAFVTVPSEGRICHSTRMKDFGRLSTPYQHPLTEADFTSINQLYGSMRDVLSAAITGRLPTALTYYQQAFRTDIDWSVRFLGMMMAMEALFGHGASEISHQVSERAAFFLKQTPSEREALYDQMRSHYSLRSKIAHGGAPNGAREKLENAFSQLLSLLRDSLRRIFEEPKTLTLFRTESSEHFNKAMRNLVFHGTATPQS